MKTVPLLFLTMILLFGCMGAPVEEIPLDDAGDENISEDENVSDEEGGELLPTGEEECEPRYTFSMLESAKLSEDVRLSVTATCAGDKEITLLFNDQVLEKKNVLGDDPIVLNFDVPALEDATNTLSVKSDGETIYAENWDVAPLGSSDTSATSYDQVSNKRWLAVSFDIGNPVDIESVGAYVRRLDSMSLEDSYLVYEIREDEEGVPSPVSLCKSRVSVDEITLSKNWHYGNVDGMLLDPGRYWLVMRVEKTEPTLVGDAVNIYYTFEDRMSDPSGDVMQMSLEWNDNKREWLQTPWKLPAYEKEYVVVISSQED